MAAGFGSTKALVRDGHKIWDMCQAGIILFLGQVCCCLFQCQLVLAGLVVATMFLPRPSWGGSGYRYSSNNKQHHLLLTVWLLHSTFRGIWMQSASGTYGRLNLEGPDDKDKFCDLF